LQQGRLLLQSSIRPGKFRGAFLHPLFQLGAGSPQFLLGSHMLRNFLL
jgi:hypothetical protein